MEVADGRREGAVHESRTMSVGTSGPSFGPVVSKRLSYDAKAFWRTLGGAGTKVFLPVERRPRFQDGPYRWFIDIRILNVSSELGLEAFVGPQPAGSEVHW